MTASIIHALGSNVKAAMNHSWRWRALLQKRKFRVNCTRRARASIKYKQPGSLHLVFVYGVYKRDEPMTSVTMDPESGYCIFKGLATTCDRWPLVIASKYNIPYMLYSKGIGHHILGDVYEMDDAKVGRFDELEGHPQYYERELIPVRYVETKAIVDVSCYFLKDYKPQLLRLPFLKDYSSKGPHKKPFIPK